MNYLKQNNLGQKVNRCLLVAMMLLIMMKPCSSSNLSGKSKKTYSSSKQMIVLLYNRKLRKEKVLYVDYKPGSINIVRTGVMENIPYWLRNLRYQDSTGKLTYIDITSLKGEENDPSYDELKDYVIFTYSIVKRTIKGSFSIKIPWPRFQTNGNVYNGFLKYFLSNTENTMILQNPETGGKLLTVFSIGEDGKVIVPQKGDILIKKIQVNRKSKFDYYRIVNILMSGDGKGMCFYAVKNTEVRDILYPKTKKKISELCNISYRLFTIQCDEKHRISSKDYTSQDYNEDKLNLQDPVLLAANFPIFKKEKGIHELPIPHKCWSPDGKYILFVGALEQPGVGNVYKVNIHSGKIEKVLGLNDKSGSFNPELEWTKYGILITCKNAVYYKQKGKKFIKIEMPSNTLHLYGGRVSPDGKEIMLTGEHKDKVFLFVYEVTTGKITKKEISNKKVDGIQGSWIYKDRQSIIKNEFDDYYYKLDTSIFEGFKK